MFKKLRNEVAVCKGFTLIELLVVIAIISLLVSILLPSLNKARDLAKQVVCSTQLRSATMAVVLFESENGHIPFVFRTSVDYEPWTTMVASQAGWSEEVTSGDPHAMVDASAKQRQCPASEEAFIGMNYGGSNMPGAEMYAPSIMEPVGAFSTNTPITLDAIGDPSSWLMMADVGYVWGYTHMGYSPVGWAFNSDLDGDGLRDTSSSVGFIYNGFMPRVHPLTPVALSDGHVESVEFESLWETNSAGNVVHDFWWDDTCSFTP